LNGEWEIGGAGQKVKSVKRIAAIHFLLIHFIGAENT
jgi:hypothetical protein